MSLGKCNHVVPGFIARDATPDDDHRSLRLRQRLGRLREMDAITADMDSADAPRLDRFALPIPIVDGDRNESRATRRLHRNTISARDRGGHVLCPGRLTTPLDVWPRKFRGAFGEKKRFVRQNRSRLLPGGNHQRSLVAIGGEQIAKRMAQPGSRVEVDEGRVARRLSKTVGHTQYDRFLQAKHISEIVGKIPVQRQLGGTRIAKNRRHAECAHQIDRGITDRSGAHLHPQAATRTMEDESHSGYCTF